MNKITYRVNIFQHTITDVCMHGHGQTARKQNASWHRSHGGVGTKSKTNNYQADAENKLTTKHLGRLHIIDIK